MSKNCVKLEIYVPEEYAGKLKAALFEAGAGKIGNYDCCCWQTPGTGQFRPLAGSNAFIGKQGNIEKVPETKIELLCPAEKIKEIIEALKKAHPYETPAFQYWNVEIV
ncbi:MAG: YqfO family protein [Victivallaceae bacterium]|nr:YqfO family protein [Victivallaceae bacterium]